MKIVDRATFLAMPEGTVFAKYKPCVFEEWQIKGETGPFDFTCMDLVSFEVHDSADFASKLEESQRLGTTIPLSDDYFGRDGCFDEDQLFAVLDTEDVKLLIRLLEKCIKHEVGEAIFTPPTSPAQPS